MVAIAHASLDENRNARNGTAGDQTGKEVCIRTWYNKPWNCVIRFTDPKMALKVSNCMVMAALNNNIGYDQNQRNTLLNEARKYGYDTSKVAKPCETDCSALVSVACMYAGIPESQLTIHGNCLTTRTLRNALKASGEVDIFTTAIYTSRTEKLKIGDILLKEGAHVAVVVQADDIPYMLASNLLRLGDKNESVKWLQAALNKNGARLVVDGDFGPRTKQALMDYQRTHKDLNGKQLEVDGIAGPLSLGVLKKG